MILCGRRSDHAVAGIKLTMSDGWNCVSWRFIVGGHNTWLWLIITLQAIVFCFNFNDAINIPHKITIMLDPGDGETKHFFFKFNLNFFFFTPLNLNFNLKLKLQHYDQKFFN